MLERRRVIGGKRRASTSAAPRRWRVDPAPPPMPTRWAEPPPIEAPARRLTTGRPMQRAERFDLALLEHLNEEYRERPVNPAPQAYTQRSLGERARERLEEAHASIDLGGGKRVLEFGCGTGFEVWFVSHVLGADADGIDIVEREAWRHLRDDRTRYWCADLTDANPFAVNTFDRVMSFTVFEHVRRPHPALRELHAVMKPGGLAWIKANLYRSALGSHLYRDLFFPWPHLLFSEDVIEEFFEQRGQPGRRPAWVNKLTWAQYERLFEQVGFTIRMLRFNQRPLDREFYERFEDALSRYPEWDLTHDFFIVVLEKTASDRFRVR